jgi:predicted secreted hydrolase
MNLTHVPLKVPVSVPSDTFNRVGSPKSFAGYTAFTRLRSSGTITFGGQRVSVTGESWLDHEYGDGTYPIGVVGRDLFELQLVDGRELIFSMIRLSNGRLGTGSSGVVIERNGRLRKLLAGEFSVTDWGGQTWTSPHSPARYPVLWRISVSRPGLLFSLSPTVADQEIQPTAGGVPYWEGSVVAQDEASGGAVLGVGVAQLTGYGVPYDGIPHSPRAAIRQRPNR